MAQMNEAGLALLLQRRSARRLVEPAPDDEALSWMLKAAARVPDFRKLRPYRFLAARGKGREALGELIHEAALAAGKSDQVLKRCRTMPLRAPLLIIVVASPRPDKIVPELDQLLCAGCTVQALQLAAQALGFASIWRSGWAMYDATLKHRLGLAATEQIVGFLYVGSRAEAVADDPDPLPGIEWIGEAQ